MKTVRYPESNLGASPCVAALGFFDGVHLGHRALIALAKDAAKKRALPLAVFTFPSDSPALKSGAPRLTATEEKAAVFASLGVDLLILCDFEAVKDLSPEAFVRDVLIRDLRVKAAVTGASFRFGKGASGTPALLASLLRENGAEHLLCPDCLSDGETVSSALIRSLLAKGEIGKAGKMLSSPVSFCGTVEEGIGLAGKEGVPTVNTVSDKLALFKAGVYASLCEVNGKKILAVTNIGTCPTVGGRTLHAETHLIGFKGDLYGETITVTLLDFMREEKRFSTADELFLQIKVDIQDRISRKD